MAKVVRGKCRTEQLCIYSWYRNWTSDQRERFQRLLRQELAATDESTLEDDLLTTFQNIDLSGRPSTKE